MNQAISALTNGFINPLTLPAYNFVPEIIKHPVETLLVQSIQASSTLLAGFNRREIKVAGLRTVFLEAGNRSKPTIILLHGFSDSKQTFVLAARRLKRRFHVLIPDIPGFGESQVDFSLTHDADFYSGWLKHFLLLTCDKKHQSAHIVGNSLGGALALKFAQHAPEYIDSLVLINSAGVVGKKPTGIYEEILSGKNIFLVNSADDFEEFFSRLFYRVPSLPLPVYGYLSRQYKSKALWHEKLFNDIAGGDIYNLEKESMTASELARIKIPTLVMWGRHDSLFHTHIGEHIASNMPVAKIKVISRAGHLPQMERPFYTGRHIERFLCNL